MAQSGQYRQSNVAQSGQYRQSNVAQSVKYRQSNVAQSVKYRQSNVAQSGQYRQSNVAQSNVAQSGQYKQNFADNMQMVLNMAQTNEFVQHVVVSKAKVPSVILYLSDQVQNLKRFCCSGQSVLGVDKTFNLGQVFVTTTVFKHKALLRTDTGENPIFFGPMFLHGNCTFETYLIFMSHLAGILSTYCKDQLTIGSDDDAALRKAVAEAFPETLKVLCTRHLRKNVESYLQDKVGVKQGHRVEIVNSIFGSSGVIQANNSVDFSSRLTKTKNLCTHVAPGFVEYFTEHLCPLLEQQVKGTTKSQSAGASWTNNNAESANHLLKIATQWKPRSVVELIEKLQGVVAALYKDVRRR